LIKLNGETYNDSRRLHYTRLLTRAAVEAGHVDLYDLTGTRRAYQGIAYWHQCPPVDNALAAMAYLGMHSPLQKIIEDGAKDNQTYFGTPLSCAALTGNLEIVRTLLATITVSPDSWLLAMGKAARHGHLEILRLLIDFKRPELNYDHYNYVIIRAASVGQVEVLQFLLPERGLFSRHAQAPPRHNPNHEQEGFWLEVILRQACLAGKESVLRMALERDADPIIRFCRYDRRGPLALASFGGHEKLILVLLSQPKLREDERFSRHLHEALYWAARSGRLDILKLLLEHGAEINIKRTFWRHNAWVGAAERNRIDALQFLIEHGAELTFNDIWTNQTLERIKKRGYTTILQILEVHGIKHRATNNAKRSAA
jgi:ankyrin repeat protein